MTTRPTGFCPVCGGTVETGCRPGFHRPIWLPGEAPLSKEDWAELYHFIRYTYLPFIHRIVARARARANQETEHDPEISNP